MKKANKQKRKNNLQSKKKKLGKKKIKRTTNAHTILAPHFFSDIGGIMGLSGISPKIGPRKIKNLSRVSKVSGISQITKSFKRSKSDPKSFQRMDSKKVLLDDEDKKSTDKENDDKERIK